MSISQDRSWSSWRTTRTRWTRQERIFRKRWKGRNNCNSKRKRSSSKPKTIKQGQEVVSLRRHNTPRRKKPIRMGMPWVLKNCGSKCNGSRGINLTSLSLWDWGKVETVAVVQLISKNKTRLRSKRKTLPKRVKKQALNLIQSFKTWQCTFNTSYLNRALQDQSKGKWELVITIINLKMR